MPHRPTRNTLLRQFALALFALIVLAGYLWFLRFGAALAYPQWPRLQPDQQADLANKFQILVIQATGAGGAGIAVWFTHRTYKLSRRGQVTDRFTKALEQLGSPEAYLRLGGVHALEQVLTEAPAQHTAIVEVLVAFIRQHAPHRVPAQGRPEKQLQLFSQPDPEWPPEPAPDVQAALTALGRRPRRPEQTKVDLHDLHLTDADLGGANLSGAYLSGAVLTSAFLREVNLTHADLEDADLSDAFLRDADLTHAHLNDADLATADLT